MRVSKFILASALALSVCADASALRLEKIRFGDFSQWVTRTITESKVIGGKTKTVYAIGPTQTIRGNYPYKPQGGTPWATSNVYARVSGVTKASNTVSPAKINGNTVAKMETRIEHVKVLGMLNMEVMVPGTIYLGRNEEPISSTKDPYAKMEMGIPYTKRPAALVFDYRIDMPNVNTRVKATGFGRQKTIQGRDQAEVYIILQKRWEDAKGNIYAKRVGTGRERYNRSIPWTTGHQVPVHYGDITGKSFYRPYMGLLDGKKAYHAYNSKGKLVPVHEVGWAHADETPTHMLIMASTTCGEAFVGTEGVAFYIDNVALGF